MFVWFLIWDLFYFDQNESVSIPHTTKKKRKEENKLTPLKPVPKNLCTEKNGVFFLIKKCYKVVTQQLTYLLTLKASKCGWTKKEDKGKKVNIKIQYVRNADTHTTHIAKTELISTSFIVSAI